ncbi:hypothetical protein ACPPVO_21455 [Dactylosporangium sp. McL0621]|uniref:hypothetical protein n=1 Tax=Dactylosporangium sp. McL0621 TaxID=3415678 RepID=UPI003CF86C78
MRRWTWAAVAVVLLLCAGCCGVAGRYYGEAGERLDRVGRTTEAVVVERGERGRFGHGPAVTFLTWAGERPQVRCVNCDQGLAPGERVDIRYDPEDPYADVEDAGRPMEPRDAQVAWSGAALCLALLLLLVWQWVKAVRGTRRRTT